MRISRRKIYRRKIRKCWKPSAKRLSRCCCCCWFLLVKLFQGRRLIDYHLHHFHLFISNFSHPLWKTLKLKCRSKEMAQHSWNEIKLVFFVLFCLNNKMKNFSASQVCRWTHSLKLDEADEEASSSIIIQNRRKDKQVFGWTGLLLLTERRGQARGSAQ